MNPDFMMKTKWIKNLGDVWYGGTKEHEKFEVVLDQVNYGRYRPLLWSIPS